MSLILPHVERLNRYATGGAPANPGSALKLNQNESPYPPSPRVQEALSGIGAGQLRCYPDESALELRCAIAEHHGLQVDHIFAGNGSSEIISIIMKVFVGAGGRLALPDPTFELYHTSAWSFQADTIRVPLDDDYRVNIDRLLETAARAVILVNPNAPTGRLLELGEVRKLAAGFPGLVVIDEAYMDFAQAGASAIPLLNELGNVMVLRTFSKAYGLSGLRVGYALASCELIGALEKGKDIYNVNAVSARLAWAALKDRSYTDRIVAEVKRVRTVFTERLQELGFDVIPSEANFVLCRPPEGMGRPTAKGLYERLEERGVYVRYFNRPRLDDKLRISVGTEEQMERVADALEVLVRWGRA